MAVTISITWPGGGSGRFRAAKTPSPGTAGSTPAAGHDSRFAALNGIPEVDFPSNLQAAVAAGRRMASILREVVELRIGQGKLTPNEYFVFRLWEPRFNPGEKRRFVGKQAQHPMHIACNDTGWYAAAADKLLFHTLMAGAGLPTPELLAITQPRRAGGAQTLTGPDAVAAFLRNPANYPLFAKPIDGKYSLSVVSADGFDAAADRIRLQGADIPGALPGDQSAAPGAAPVNGRPSPAALAETLAAREAGYLLQRRLSPHPAIAGQFGPRLWSVRLLVLVTPAGPLIHSAVAKIATGTNPADNFWRPGNMLGAVGLATGRVDRVVQGTGVGMAVNGGHPDTGRPIVGTAIPDWAALVALAKEASRLLPGIRTQSWDIAVSDAGPVPLEVNFGGDLNLAQLAHGAGVLDHRYAEHLQSCGYRI
jgi:hypothetical protein